MLYKIAEPSLVLATALLISIGCSASSTSNKSAENPATGGTLSLFVTTELKGSVEPCGCTSDPLGDLARTAALLDDARRQSDAVVYVDGGSTLYATQTKLPAHMQNQSQLKADLIGNAMSGEMAVAGIGLGPYDLTNGPAGVTPPRMAVNLPPSSGIPLANPRVVQAGGVALGLFGVVGPEALTGHSIRPSDPTAAARAAIGQLHEQGAQLVIAIAHMPHRAAHMLAKDVGGIDILIVGQDAPDPDEIRDAPRRVNNTWLVQPANQGQVVTRMDVNYRGAGHLEDAVGEFQAKARIATLDERIKRLNENLNKWQGDPTADQGFVSQKRSELLALEREKAQLKKNPLQIPKEGNWFVLRQVRIRKSLPCNKAVQDAKVAFDKAAGAANLAAAANIKPEPPEKGKAGFVGQEECGFCHKPAVEFWKRTRHEKAWETLEDLGKAFDYECIGCHVTGWEQPGGATLAHNQALRDVQCETCHGPGSIHVDEDGKEKPKTLVLAPEQSVCIHCHNEKHSDTFEFQAYLRDVTGPGHGEEYRKKLGDGPTGHQLRSAALQKAGANIGKGCIK